MGYCPCFGRRKKRKHDQDDEFQKCNEKCRPSDPTISLPPEAKTNEMGTGNKSSDHQSSLANDGVFNHDNKARVYNYRELATATGNFHPDNFLGEGGFGSVYQGKLEKTGQLVAVKKLNPLGLQGEKEFLVEVLMLSLLRHPNLVNMIGYCAEGDQRLLVLELMPLRSLESHLYDLPPEKDPLDWDTRMKIAAGAAKGVDYLHNEADPPVIFRDLKPSNILLDQGFNAKLSDFGLAKFGPTGDSSHVSTRVMGTHGYCAPEYLTTGKLTPYSDTYSFGVVLLELITGCRALDLTRKYGKHSLIDWVRPLLADKKNHVLLVDSRLKGKFSRSALHKALEVAAMCLNEKGKDRPTMHEVAIAMQYLSSPRHAYSITKHVSTGVTISNENSIPIKDQIGALGKEFDREQAVAEAKMWGEKYRDKRRQSSGGSSDGTSSWVLKVQQGGKS